MNKTQVANLIFEMLGEILSGTDFRLKKSEDGFVRKISNGRQMLGVPLWDYNPEFEFSLNICIRLDAVEDVFHLFSGSPPKYHSMSFTMMTRLAQFTGGPRKYKVKTADDVASAGAAFSPAIQNNILPFFNENQDVKALDRMVNGTGPKIDITLNPSGAMHAVILARLAGNPDCERLVIKLRNDMQLAADVAHPFNQLVEYLRRQ